MNSLRDGYHSHWKLNLNQEPTKEAAATTKQSEQNKPGADEQPRVIVRVAISGFCASNTVQKTKQNK